MARRRRPPASGRRRRAAARPGRDRSRGRRPRAHPAHRSLRRSSPTRTRWCGSGRPGGLRRRCSTGSPAVSADASGVRGPGGRGRVAAARPGRAPGPCLVLRAVLARIGVFLRVQRPVRAAGGAVPVGTAPVGLERAGIGPVVGGRPERRLVRCARLPARLAGCPASPSRGAARRCAGVRAGREALAGCPADPGRRDQPPRPRRPRRPAVPVRAGRPRPCRSPRSTSRHRAAGRWRVPRPAAVRPAGRIRRRRSHGAARCGRPSCRRRACPVPRAARRRPGSPGSAAAPPRRRRRGD